MRTDEKFWQTLVRVEKESEHFVYFIIPAWNAHESVCVFKNTLPKEIQELITIDKRFHVMVNIGVEFNYQIRFQDWKVR